MSLVCNVLSEYCVTLIPATGTPATAQEHEPSAHICRLLCAVPPYPQCWSSGSIIQDSDAPLLYEALAKHAFQQARTASWRLLPSPQSITLTSANTHPANQPWYTLPLHGEPFFTPAPAHRVPNQEWLCRAAGSDLRGYIACMPLQLQQPTCMPALVTLKPKVGLRAKALHTVPWTPASRSKTATLQSPSLLQQRYRRFAGGMAAGGALVCGLPATASLLPRCMEPTQPEGLR